MLEIAENLRMSLSTPVAHLNKNADLFPSDDREILSNYENCCIEVQTDVFRIRK